MFFLHSQVRPWYIPRYVSLASGKQLVWSWRYLAMECAYFVSQMRLFKVPPGRQFALKWKTMLTWFFSETILGQVTRDFHLISLSVTSPRTSHRGGGWVWIYIFWSHNSHLLLMSVCYFVRNNPFELDRRCEINVCKLVKVKLSSLLWLKIKRLVKDRYWQTFWHPPEWALSNYDLR